MLQQIGAGPPYVLVGFSWGGMLAHYFAGYYPAGGRAQQPLRADEALDSAPTELADQPAQLADHGASERPTL